MSQEITDITPHGPGPFALPLLAKLVSIDRFDPRESFLVARFEFEDGAEIHIPMDWQAVNSFVLTIQTLPAVWKARGLKTDD